MAVFYLIIAVILFIGLVLIHEWGHFVAARRGGVEVEEYGLGFPPKVWSKKIKTAKSKFLLSVNLLPLGGFVKLKGENDDDDRPGSFGAAPLSTKVKIILAGVFMNLVVAVLLFMILALIGMPKLVDNQFTVKNDTKLVSQVKNPDTVKVANIAKDSPAEKAGLKTGDFITNFAGAEIKQVLQVGEISKSNAGKEVPITVKRGDQATTYNVKLNNENKGDGYLGISSESGSEGYEVRRSTWSAPVVAVGLTGQFTKLTFVGLGNIVSSLAHGDREKASEQVTGPVGVAYILNAVSKVGFNFVLMIIAIISLSLAIMNVLPIPALDGGRLFTILGSRLFGGKRLSKQKEDLIHGIGFVVLMLLFVLITFVDVKRFIL